MNFWIWRNFFPILSLDIVTKYSLTKHYYLRICPQDICTKAKGIFVEIRPIFRPPLILYNIAVAFVDEIAGIQWTILMKMRLSSVWIMNSVSFFKYLLRVSLLQYYDQPPYNRFF